MTIFRALRIGSRVNLSTAASVLYVDANGRIAQDNANFNWDDSGKILTVNSTILCANDLLIKCATNKTLVLDKVVYDDVNAPFDSARVPAANNPTWSSFQGNLNAYAFGIDDYLEITSETFHKYKEGTDLVPHIHWVTNGLDGADRTVKWEIEYSIANMDSTDGVGDAFPSTTVTSTELVIPANTPDLTHMITSLTAITGTSLKIGAYVKARIRRIASTGTEPTADPFGLAMGVHYQVDTIGSRFLADK